jgi:uncharacterized protein (DUF1810 family)
MASDPFNLQRFVDAQDRVYDRVLSELRRGEKTTHWMWFIFPQLRGLGHSPTATMYGLSSREEAIAYLQHPILGQRLKECTVIVNETEGRSLEEIFGYPDDLKFKSCMTLFAVAAPEESAFKDALEKYCGGKMDKRTVELL